MSLLNTVNNWGQGPGWG